MTPPLTSLTRPRLPRADARLLEAVKDGAKRPLVAAITAHTLQALADLSRLDESLYMSFMEAGGRTSDGAASSKLLQRLLGVTFAGLRGLLTVTPRLRPPDPSSLPPAPRDGPMSMDFNFDSLGEEVAAPPEDESFDLGDIDIDGALDNIIDDGPDDPKARWKEFAEKISAIEYGLRTQLQALEERFAGGAIEQLGGIPQLLESLDDTRTSVGEGLYAILVAIYEAFLPGVDPSSLAPGYLSALSRAMLVRRGISDLARSVDPHNAIVQDTSMGRSEQEVAYQSVGEVLSDFVTGPVFRAMRPADRWELKKFEKSLSEQPLEEARLVCEGFAKYIESLGSVNQREVLQVHDAKTMHDLRELLAAARPLVTVSLKAAVEMVRQALGLAEKLYGLNRANDDLLAAVRDAEPVLDTESEVEGVIATLELLLDDAQ